MKTYAILLASGTGSRFGGEIPKQFVEVNGRPIISYTLDVCDRTTEIDEIVVVVSAEYLDYTKKLSRSAGYTKPIRIVEGGATRQESVKCGYSVITDEDAKVLVHNAVQPFITEKTFADCVVALDRFMAVTVGSPCVYTVLQIDADHVLRQIVPRAQSVNDLGPECFRLSFLKRVFAVAGQDAGFTNITGMILKHNLGDVYVVDGDATNIKITYADDIALAKKILEERATTTRQ